MPNYWKNEKQIVAHHSHTTITPYKLGENKKFENRLSVYIEAEYRFDNIGYFYDKANLTLYIPRGIDLIFLQKEFNCEVMVDSRCTKPEYIKGIRMTVPPRDRIQLQAIEFLSGQGDHIKVLKNSQQALVLDTGDGKTYSAIHAIANYGMNAVIITHQDKIKTQWMTSFLNMTNITLDRMMNLTGSGSIMDVINGTKKANVYFVNHQTLQSFAKIHGWKAVKEFFESAHIGIKVFDEAHLNFRNVVLIDFFSNVYKTFYLTANFGRTDTNEGRLYKRVFANVVKFGEETKNYVEKRKHIIYVPVLYNSNPTDTDRISVINSYGFSVLNFCKYALHDDEEKTQLHHFLHVLNIAVNIEGKILVTVPKIDDTIFLADIIRKEFPGGDYTVGTINSRNSKEDNEFVKKSCDIICSTIKSCGTGVDIKGLRCIINLEPFSSPITTNQLAGRLREYSPVHDTYLFDLIDLSFKTCANQYKTKLSHLRKKCKEIQVMKRN